MLFVPYVCFQLSLGNRFAAYWEIAAHSAHNTIVNRNITYISEPNQIHGIGYFNVSELINFGWWNGNTCHFSFNFVHRHSS